MIYMTLEEAKEILKNTHKLTSQVTRDKYLAALRLVTAEALKPPSE